MYGLLIVDDDEMERRGIRSLPLFDALGIEVVGEAWNGSEALLMCDRLCPQIVLTDVRMPVMDGLKFSSELGLRHPGTQIIMMSGYEDFEAVRLAVSVGARAFLTKPLALPDLQAALTRTVGALRGDENKEQQDLRMHERLGQMMPIMRERLLLGILLGACGADDPQTALEAQTMCAAFWDVPLCVMAVQLHMNALPPERQLSSSTRAGDMLAQMCVALDAQLISISGGQYALIFSLAPTLDDEAVFDSLQAHAAHVLESLQAELGCSLTIGVSAAGQGLWALCKLYTQALSALQKQALYSPNRVYWYEQAALDMPLPSLSSTLKQLEQRMFSHDTNGIRAVLDAFFRGLHDAGSSIEYARILCADLIFRYSLLAHADGKDFLSLFDGREIPYAKIMSVQTMTQLQLFLTDVCVRALEALYVRPSTQSELLVARVHKIVAAQYANPISATTIAKEVFLTESHLRRVFKNVTGQTISEYILATRMKRACELLRGTDMRVFEVAGAVGYENHSYFSIVFRKYFGKAPGEYRDEFS